MGKKLEAATNGRLSIQMFPSMQLGGEKEMIEQAQLGALQIARISVGAVGPVVDDVNVFNMPFVFRNSKHMEKVIDGEIGDELLNKISDEREDQPDRAVLDERRLAQHLQQQAADQDHGRPQGPQGPHDGQSAVRRHHECAWRQRRRARLRSGLQLDADRRGRWRGKQSAVVHGAEPQPGRQILHDDRAPDHSGTAWCSRASPGRSCRRKIRR